MPKRIQRKRVKGWRKPEGAVIVCRPSRFGNPFTRRGCREAGYTGSDAEIKARCVEAFRVWLTSQDWQLNWAGPVSEARRAYILEHLPELRGKDLLCYCDLREPCHADVLLELANSAM